MGALCGKAGPTPAEIEAEKRAKKLASQLTDNSKADNSVIKLLLLGAGESGKSTLFKQLVSLYSPKDEKEQQEQKRYVGVIHSNIIVNAQALATASNDFGEPTTPEGQAAKELILGLSDQGTVVTKDVARQILSLWRDPGIQKCYDMRASYQLNDSTQYFFDRLPQITEPGWLPTHDDIVRTRIRTTGIVEHKFEIGGNLFKMFDVGGQRNERKKWIHCFENVTAVMFVVAISEFDQVLFEDYNTNRMQEAITLFTDIVNSPFFKKVAFILFLNKDDLFREKIATRNITDSTCLELKSFQGNCRDYKETTDFLKQLFIGKKKQQGGDRAGAKIHCHLTCATNKDLVNQVFNAVKEIIVQAAMNELQC